MTTGMKISNLRKSEGITQEELAEKLGTTRQAVSKWESDQSIPDVSNLVKISELFGCTTDYLLKAGVQMPNGTKATDPSQKSDVDDTIICRSMSWDISKMEYRSKKTVFGLPLIHVCFKDNEWAKGIIAVGKKASGIISCGLLSVGILSFGLVSLGIFAAGLISLGLAAAAFAAVGVAAAGAVSVGVFAVGAVAIGYYAYGAVVILPLASTFGGNGYGAFVHKL